PGGLELEHFARAVVEQMGDRIEIVLTMHAKIGALGQILADQAIGVLVAATLPGAIGIGEVDLDAGGPGELGVTRHLAAGTVAERLAQARRHVPGQTLEAVLSGERVAAFQASNHDWARGALDKRANGGAVMRTPHQVAFPMTWHQPLGDVLWPRGDAQFLGDATAPVGAARARPTGLVPLAQTGQERAPQLAARQGIERDIDALVADGGGGIVRVHALEPAG